MGNLVSITTMARVFVLVCLFLFLGNFVDGKCSRTGYASHTCVGRVIGLNLYPQGDILDLSACACPDIKLTCLVEVCQYKVIILKSANTLSGICKDPDIIFNNILDKNGIKYGMYINYYNYFQLTLCDPSHPLTTNVIVLRNVYLQIKRRLILNLSSQSFKS